MSRIYTGISGWTYPGWRGVFYPRGLPHRRELEYASRQLRSIEINGTHYSLQRPETFQRWHDETPRRFLFSVKGSRYITHIKRLKNIEKPLANFFASGVLALREKLGPFLWQLPPSLKFDPGHIGVFLSLLPHSTWEAARLARRHDATVTGRAWMKATPRRRLRHCLEVRHESFMVPEFFDLLRRHKVAFVFADTAGKWPYAEDLTAGFAYLRLHGDKKIYVSGYTQKALARWAKRILRWKSGGQPRDAVLVTPRNRARKTPKDVFIYFDNDTKVKAPADAKRLRAMLRE